MTTTPQAAWQWLLGALKGKPCPPFLVLIGLGDGAVLRALDEHAPLTRVLALEPDAAAARSFVTTELYRSWRASGRLAYLAHPDYAGAEEAWRVFPTTGDDAPLVLLSPQLSPREGAARAVPVLKNILFGVKGNREARRKFAPRYLVNVIRNIPAMLAGSDVRALANAYRGVPAVIVGAGPSLDGAIDDLRELSDRALIVATDTALRPLLMAGIAPQLAVGLDPSDLNMRHFMALPECRDTWLVSEMALDRRATAVFEGRTFWFRASNHQPGPWLREQGIDVGQVDVWGSVLTGAFQVAVLAGCEPIVAIGSDLAFTGDRPYARGTTYEFHSARNAALAVDVRQTWAIQIDANAPIVVPDLHGADTRSTKSMVSFRDWLVARAKASGRRVVNATGAGILFGEGIEQATLRGVLGAALDLASPAAHARGWASADGAAIAVAASRVRASLEGGRLAEAPVAAWSEFSGPGFDAAALAAALDEVSCGRAPEVHEPDISHTWTDMPEWIRTAFASLPENVGRFYGLLQRPEAETAPDAGPAGPEFSDAAWLFDAILTAALSSASPIARLDVPQHPLVPLSVRFDWPEPIRWALFALEGALASTALGPRRAAATAFFQPVAADGVSAADDPATEAIARLETEYGSRFFSSECTVAIDAWSDATREQLARRLTGTLVEDAGAGEVRSHGVVRRRLLPGPLVLVRAAAAPDDDCLRRLTGAVRAAPQSGPSPATRVIRSKILTRPVALTDRGVPYGSIAYATGDGVVCVQPKASETLLVRADGSCEVHNRWPRPIVGERPLGPYGSVAWGDGLSRFPEVESAYAMYKHDPNGAIHIEEIPVRPTSLAPAAWWHGRLYWSCFPQAVDAPFGLASWAPGEEVTLDVPELSTLIGIHPQAVGLALDPGVVVPRVGWRRQPGDVGWTWAPGRSLSPRSLTENGAASCRVVSGDWTATSFPESDLIRFDAADGRTVSMNCYYPLGLGWLEGSLMVSTGQRELLLFADLRAQLERYLE